ncbi:MAG: DNA repair protein RecN [Bacillota bacterium]
MLQRLIIHNVALIEKLDVEFFEGFNVMTGETGAGKSIIIDSVNLVIGERANRELIKHGAEKATVQAVFTFPHNERLIELCESLGVEDAEDTLILSRELSSSGKNACRANGTLVTLAALKSLCDCLIDIHGQHEHQSLLDAERHVEILDAFASEELRRHKAIVAGLCAKYHAANKRLLKGFLSEQERMRRIDILKFQITEIGAARLEPGEDNTLAEERLLLSNSEQIIRTLEEGYECLTAEDSGALANAKRAAHSVANIASFAEQYESIRSRLENAYYDLEDICFALRDAKNSFEYDPSRLDEIEKRLDIIHMLKRKYGATIEDILFFSKKCEEELFEIESEAELRMRLESERAEHLGAYRAAAEELYLSRRKAADEFEKLVLEQLKELGLTRADFCVRIEHNVEAIGANGSDAVEFYLSTNAGEPLKPLSKVASGGEMSRIMLAFKTIVAATDGIDTLIFDEIDTGISGRIASVVGEKMLSIARSRQIICVTHLPQIAAMADRHYLVQKSMAEESTTTTLILLDEQQRRHEVARIMGTNEESKLALEHAGELIDAAKQFKRKL